jgi:hypothetical protein
MTVAKSTATTIDRTIATSCARVAASFAQGGGRTVWRSVPGSVFLAMVAGRSMRGGGRTVEETVGMTVAGSVSMTIYRTVIETAANHLAGARPRPLVPPAILRSPRPVRPKPISLAIVDRLFA